MNVLTSYVRNVFEMVFTVCGSMVMGLRTFTRPNVTTEYPRKEKWDLPDGSRMKLYNNIDDCIGCYKCSRICPTDCIEIETIKAPDSVDLGTASTGNPLNFWVPTFDIDMVKCCYCDLCTTVCPTECLVMTKTYEGSAYDRGNLIYHFGNVDSQKREEINELLAEEDGGTATETATDTETETAADEPSGIMGKLVPESLEGLPLKERIRARLISRGKMEGELPEGVEIDESAAPVTQEAPAETAEATETTETQEEAPAETEEETEDEPSAEDAPSSDDESGDEDAGDGYVRDPDKPLEERIRERLKSRGKL